jgi:hypothetical protein
MNSENELILMPDNLFGALAIQDRESMLVRAADREALFGIAVEYFVQQGCIVRQDTGDASMHSELPLHIPGTAVTVRLGAPQREELVALIGAAALLVGAGKVDLRTITLATLSALLYRIRKVQAQYGERSVIEAISEIPRPTAEAIALDLFGKPCRFPETDCRYQSAHDVTCAITLDLVSATLADLEKRGIVRRLNAVDPIEFGLVF